MKTPILVCLSCILALSIGCSDNNNNLPQKSFTDTKWKFIGFVDGQTELLKKPENNLSHIYWISFYADHTLFVKSSIN
ncbi:MAG: hypothetical protein LBQ39_09975, partial [Tannerellaceae bacterium]|nr:hypothetical protein [Tannerellaceae bacterium]